MKRYTLDTNGIIFFLADQLPAAADKAFTDAAQGKVSIEMPVTAVVETVYTIHRRDHVHNVQVPLSGPDALEVVEELPLTVVKDTHADARELLSHLEVFPSQMHDAMIVSNHANRNTDAIITSDGKMADNYPTVWD